MKTKFRLPIGARYSLFALLMAVTLQSCNQIPIIDGEEPFVVSEIIEYNDTHSEYTAKNNHSGVFNTNLNSKPRIVLQTRLYQIGDTITMATNLK